VYIYKELRSRVDEVAYFGIPKDIDMDGILEDTPNKELCNTMPRLAKDVKEGCRAMHKTFFIQVRTRYSSWQEVFSYKNLTYNLRSCVFHEHDLSSFRFFLLFYLSQKPAMGQCLTSQQKR